eukprot:6200249-Pleurochrysis_carterae.AAC.2
MGGAGGVSAAGAPLAVCRRGGSPRKCVACGEKSFAASPQRRGKPSPARTHAHSSHRFHALPARTSTPSHKRSGSILQPQRWSREDESAFEQARSRQSKPEPLSAPPLSKNVPPPRRRVPPHPPPRHAPARTSCEQHARTPVPCLRVGKGMHSTHTDIDTDTQT